MRILFVENHSTFAATVVEQFLGDHAVTVRETVVDAVHAFNATDFDVALVDFDLTDEKGDEFVRRARFFDPLTPIVAVSAREHGNAMLLDAGASFMCPKTLFSDIEALLSEVQPRADRDRLEAPSTVELASAVAMFEAALTTRQRESLQAMLHDLLFVGQASWDAFRHEVITHTELRNVLLAHTQTFLIADAGSAPLEDRAAWERFTCGLVPSFERVQIGRAHV